MNLTKQEKEHLQSLVRVYENYPENGVSFKELSLIYSDVEAMKIITNYFVGVLKPLNPDCVIGCDARGFILGTLISQALELPFVMARKPGKLPGDVLSKKYGLEYGKSELQMHKHIIAKYKSPVIADDVIASGGTSIAVHDMLLEVGINVNSFIFISEIVNLNGRNNIITKTNIKNDKIFSILES